VAIMALTSMGIATEVRDDDPPRRRQRQGEPLRVEPAMHEPEVLSKRAERRARGKAKAARRGGR
jgi:hypothetical protein